MENQNGGDENQNVTKNWRCLVTLEGLRYLGMNENVERSEVAPIPALEGEDEVVNNSNRGHDDDSCKKTERANSQVDHSFAKLESEEHKQELFFTLLEGIEEIASEKIVKVIIFCDTKSKVKALSLKLKEKGFRLQYFHADMSDEAQDASLNAFNHGGDKNFRILVSTDALHIMRLDYANVIFNMGVPSPDFYLKRSAFLNRLPPPDKDTSVAQEKQVINMLCSDKELIKLREIEKALGITMDDLSACSCPVAESDTNGKK